MANPTTNFGWVMPTATDLVTDLPADFAVFGQGVDTSMAYLLGGTTGQILSKTSGTNMAFTWINNDQGDLTAITAGTGISVTSGTGPIPSVAIDTTVTVDKTTAQTLTNKTLTTPIISSISNTGTLTLPTSTDTLVGRATTDTLTNKTLTSPALTTPTISTLTTNGDLVYGTGSGALSRLGIGSSAQVLTVASGVPSWATPAGGGGMTSIASGSLSGGSVSITGIPGTYKNLMFIIQNYSFSQDGYLAIRLNNDSTSGNYKQILQTNTSASAVASEGISSHSFWYNYTYSANLTANKYMAVGTIYDYTNTTARKIISGVSSNDDTGGTFTQINIANGSYQDTTAITSLQIKTEGSPTTFSTGTYVLYGVN